MPVSWDGRREYPTTADSGGAGLREIASRSGAGLSRISGPILVHGEDVRCALAAEAWRQPRRTRGGGAGCLAEVPRGTPACDRGPMGEGTRSASRAGGCSRSAQQSTTGVRGWHGDTQVAEVVRAAAERNRGLSGPPLRRFGSVREEFGSPSLQRCDCGGSPWNRTWKLSLRARSRGSYRLPLRGTVVRIPNEDGALRWLTASQLGEPEGSPWNFGLNDRLHRGSADRLPSGRCPHGRRRREEVEPRPSI